MEMRTNLTVWFHDPKRKTKGIWLEGPAGTGKTAVAQTFAEWCFDQGCLGAAFFFSRPNGRNKFETVIPTIAYQLAKQLPAYERHLIRIIAHDPTILETTPRTQFKKLIVEAFTLSHYQNRPFTNKKLLVLLDGVDECHGVDGQRELVEMVGEFLRLAIELPLLWLLVSRPEPHFRYIFAQADFPIHCQHHRLLIDAKTREDVEKFLRHKFDEIQRNFWGIADELWPSPELFMKLVRYADGNFLLATAMSNYIAHPHFSPTERLVDFLAFMDGAKHVTTSNPLETLDPLYTRILLDVPATVMPTTRRILHHVLYKYHPGISPPTTQRVANILCLERPDFYTAVRSLYSVLDIPSHMDAVTTPIQMYHTSFKDFLASPARSGRFFISEQEARTEFSRSALFWYGIILKDRVFDGAFSLRLCQGDLCLFGIVPFVWQFANASSPIVSGLRWPSANPERLASEIDGFAYSCDNSWFHVIRVPQDDITALFSFLNTIDFRFIDLKQAYHKGFEFFLNWLLQQVHVLCVLCVPWPSVTEPLEGCLPIPPSYRAHFRP
jgi:hypothetical protein